MLVDFGLQGPDNFSAARSFSLLYVKWVSMSLPCNHDFIDLLLNSLPYPTHILFGFCPELSKNI